MKPHSLYVILDKQSTQNKSISDIASLLVEGGADLIQYRNKNGSEEEKLTEAKAIANVLKGSSTKLILNDDPKLAKKVNAVGVHLGQEDESISEARLVLGPNKVIGISTHNLKEALKAEEEGANYIAVGDLFGTETKQNTQQTSLETLKEISESVSIPVVGIGGITLENKEKVFTAGADAIAVSRSILFALNITEQCQRFKF